MGRFGDQLSDTLRKMGATPGDADELRLQGNALQDSANSVGQFYDATRGNISSGALNLPISTIDTQTIEIPSSVVTFDYIPQNYSHLWFVASAKSNLATEANVSVGMRFNGVAATSGTYMYVENIAYSSGLTTPNAGAHSLTTHDRLYIGSVPASSGAVASAQGVLWVWIPGYGNNLAGKAGFAQGGWNYKGDEMLTMSLTYWFGSTEAINSIWFKTGTSAAEDGGQFVAGSKFTLIGIK